MLRDGTTRRERRVLAQLDVLLGKAQYEHTDYSVGYRHGLEQAFAVHQGLYTKPAEPFYKPKRPERCTCCGRRLRPGSVRWLELNSRTGVWSDPLLAQLAKAESQGAFPFGRACARRKLRYQGVGGTD